MKRGKGKEAKETHIFFTTFAPTAPATTPPAVPNAPPPSLWPNKPPPAPPSMAVPRPLSPSGPVATGCCPYC